MLWSPTFPNDVTDLVSVQIQIKLLPAAAFAKYLPALSFRHSGLRLCNSATSIFFQFSSEKFEIFPLCEATFVRQR